MADADAQNRNLPASQRKLQKARAEGQVPRSRDLGHFAALAAGGLGLAWVLPGVAAWLQNVLGNALRLRPGAANDPAFMAQRLAEWAQVLLTVAVGVAVAMLLAGVLGRFTVPPAAAGVGAPGVGVPLRSGVDEDL